MFTEFKSAFPPLVRQDLWRILYTSLLLGGGILAACWIEWLFRSLE